MTKKKASTERQLDEGQKSETNTQEGNETMTILAPTLRLVEPDPFDTTLTVDARFAGGTITLDPEFVDWLGETLVNVDLPGLSIVLRTYEARDLASALQSLAQHIDEEQPRSIKRPVALAAAPDTNGVGGGL